MINGLLQKIRASVRRHEDLPVALRLRKGWNFATSLASAPLLLVQCTSVGKRARTFGRPHIENYGRITIGDDFNLSSQFVRSHIVAGPGAVVAIGDSVSINFGSGIAADYSIKIGDRVRIGPYAMIHDTDFHASADKDAKPEPSPVVIEDDVWLGGRVTVLKGAIIGKGSVITAGSVVVGTIPPGVVAGGNPARVIRATGAEASPLGTHSDASRADVLPTIENVDKQIIERVRGVIAEIFSLDEPPGLDDGPHSIGPWDSLGQLRLATGLERQLQLAFSDDDMIRLRDVRTAVQIVARHQQGGSSTPNASNVVVASTSDFDDRVVPAIASQDLSRVVHQAFIHAARLVPHKVALLCDDDATSYAALLSRSYAIADALADANIGTGDRVLFMLADKAEYIAAFYGILARGAVAVPVLDSAALGTVLELAEACDGFVMVADKAALGKMPKLAKDKRFTCLDVAGMKVAPEGEGPRHALPEMKADDTALIMFTSGTTSRKKAVRLSHNNLMQSVLNINAFMNIDGAIREYVSIPFTHSFGLGRLRCVLSLGGTLIFHNGPLNPASMSKAIEQHRANALSAVPAGIGMFFGGFERMLESIGKRIEVMEFGSASMPAAHKAQLLELFPKARICMHYGLTEASRSAFIEFRSELDKLDTVGRPSPNVEIKICNAKGKQVSANTEGEVVVRGDHVTTGYWGDEAINRRTMRPDGSFRTGDYGFMDDEGYLHLLGRKDDMINMGGIKISPLEVEQKLRLAYPELDMCVLGIPDPDNVAGEIPALAYVPADSEVEALTLAQVREALRETLESTKVPRLVMAMEKLPKTQNGKVKRAVLRKIIVNMQAK